MTKLTNLYRSNHRLDQFMSYFHSGVGGDFDCAVEVVAGTWPSDCGEACRVAVATTLRRMEKTSSPIDGVNIALADDFYVQDLNKRYRFQDKPTNVLAFGSGLDDSRMPAFVDIVLAFETVVRESQEQGKKLQDHLMHLVVHGFLHLLGWQHEDDRSARQMEDIEVLILSDLGLDDPYIHSDLSGNS